MDSAKYFIRRHYNYNKQYSVNKATIPYTKPSVSLPVSNISSSTVNGNNLEMNIHDIFLKSLILYT